ncbi:MAG: hypothetical protein GY797_04960, partial [Deltaproteobacteria bacterium]|nr:hypothetical protein [Deltaproteobacteria bacterium]
MRQSIEQPTTVTLDTMDESNLVPMFNAYCWAAEVFEKRKEENNVDAPLHKPCLPCLDADSWRRVFTEAGLVVEKRPESYCIISLCKGGVCYSFRGKKAHIDTGVVARDKKGRLYSSQAYQPDNEIVWKEDKVYITSQLVRMHTQLPTPLQFLILRLLNITVMRNRKIGNVIKKFLVQFLITGNKRSPVRNHRTISFGEGFKIIDEWSGDNTDFERIMSDAPFSAIHMASQGYWQRQDDST